MNDAQIAHSIASLGTDLGTFLPVLGVISGILGLILFIMGWLDLESHHHHGAMMRHSWMSGANARRGFAGIIIGVLLLTVPELVSMIAGSMAMDNSAYANVFGSITVNEGDLLSTAKGFTDVIMAVVGIIAVFYGLNMLNATAQGAHGEHASFKAGLSFIIGGVVAIHYQGVIGAIVHSIDLPALTNIYQLVFPG